MVFVMTDFFFLLPAAKITAHQQDSTDEAESSIGQFPRRQLPTSKPASWWTDSTQRQAVNSDEKDEQRRSRNQNLRRRIHADKTGSTNSQSLPQSGQVPVNRRPCFTLTLSKSVPQLGHLAIIDSPQSEEAVRCTVFPFRFWGLVFTMWALSDSKSFGWRSAICLSFPKNFAISLPCCR